MYKACFCVTVLLFLRVAVFSCDVCFVVNLFFIWCLEGHWLRDCGISWVFCLYFLKKNATFLNLTLYYLIFTNQNQNQNILLVIHQQTCIHQGKIGYFEMMIGISGLCLKVQDVRECFFPWHNENTPNQVYWKCHHQKPESFQRKILMFFIFLLKT